MPALLIEDPGFVDVDFREERVFDEIGPITFGGEDSGEYVLCLFDQSEGTLEFSPGEGYLGQQEVPFGSFRMFFSYFPVSYFLHPLLCRFQQRVIVIQFRQFIFYLQALRVFLPFVKDRDIDRLLVMIPAFSIELLVLLIAKLISVPLLCRVVALS